MTSLVERRVRNSFPSTRIGVASKAAFLLSGVLLYGWSAPVRCVQAPTWSPRDVRHDRSARASSSGPPPGHCRNSATWNRRGPVHAASDGSQTSAVATRNKGFQVTRGVTCTGQTVSSTRRQAGRLSVRSAGRLQLEDPGSDGLLDARVAHRNKLTPYALSAAGAGLEYAANLIDPQRVVADRHPFAHTRRPSRPVPRAARSNSCPAPRRGSA